MTTSDMIRELCEKQNISLAELSRRIGQTPQNEYYVAAEPPVRCGVSHLSGLTEPLI